MKIMATTAKIKIVFRKRDPIAKDLLTPKYRQRVVEDKRKKEPRYKERYDVVS